MAASAGLDLSKRYGGIPKTSGDGGSTASTFSYGMPSRLGYLSLMGPGTNNEIPLGPLTDSYDAEMTNGFTYDQQAFGLWLEPNPGTPQWTVNLARSAPREASIASVLATVYGIASGGILDFQWLPFVLCFDFEHCPGTWAANIANAYSAQWQWFSVVITNYRWTFADGSNTRRIRERFTASSRGESFADGVNGNNAKKYVSEPTQWASNYFSIAKVSAAGGGGGGGGGNSGLSGIGTGLPESNDVGQDTSKPPYLR